MYPEYPERMTGEIITTRLIESNQNEIAKLKAQLELALRMVEAARTVKSNQFLNDAIAAFDAAIAMSGE